MENKDQKKRDLMERLRELLDSLGKALTPTRPLPQPIPVRDYRGKKR